MSKYILHMDDGTDFIAHYGRKGMKWGQHIYDVDNDFTISKGSDLGKITYGYSRGQAVAGMILNPIGTAKYLINDGKPRKGQRGYYSLNGEDSQKWAHMFNSEEAYKKPGSKSNKLKEQWYTANNDLKIAGTKTQMDLAKKMLKETKKSNKDWEKMINESHIYNEAMMDKLLRGKGKPTAKLKYGYTQSRNTGFAPAIAEELKKSGYSGVVDMFGQGTADAPVILFDQGDLKKTGSTRIKRKELPGGDIEAQYEKERRENARKGYLKLY